MSANQGRHSDPRVYIVFGATGGIGGELCRRLAGDDVQLVLAGRSAERLGALQDEVGGHAFELDACDPDSVGQCIQETAERFGRVDGIGNCVGSLLLKPAHRTTDREWTEILATNLGTAFAIVRAGGNQMSRTGGSIALVSSAAARVGLANHEAIAAAKAGIIGLTLSAAATYASRGIRVNCVAPGLVRTRLSEGIMANEMSRKASLAMHALGRVGEPADVASVLAWLLREDSDWVTGQVFGIDGGLSTVRARRSAG